MDFVTLANMIMYFDVGMFIMQSHLFTEASNLSHTLLLQHVACYNIEQMCVFVIRMTDMGVNRERCPYNTSISVYFSMQAAVSVSL